MMLIVKQSEHKGNIEANALADILREHDARLVDGSMLPHLAKIEVADENFARLKLSLGERWSVFPEIKYSVPTTKKKIRGQV